MEGGKQLASALDSRQLSPRWPIRRFALFELLIVGFRGVRPGNVCKKAIPFHCGKGRKCPLKFKSTS